MCEEASSLNPSKEAAQGGKRSAIASKRLRIAADCLLINLRVKSHLKITMTFIPHPFA